MSSEDTETALCADCQTPVEAPKIVQFSPFLSFQPAPLCKDCLLKAQVKNFERIKFKPCPYQLPYWRPSRW